MWLWRRTGQTRGRRPDIISSANTRHLYYIYTAIRSPQFRPRTRGQAPSHICSRRDYVQVLRSTVRAVGAGRRGSRKSILAGCTCSSLDKFYFIKL